MTLAITLLIALVALAGTVAVAVSLTLRIDRLSEDTAQLGTLWRETHDAAQKSTPTALKAELDDLRAALDVLRTSNRKELSSLHAKLQAANERLPVAAQDEAAAEFVDGELGAWLNAQRGVSPQ